MNAPSMWTAPGPLPPTNDPNELLRRIERNTAEQAKWLRYLVYAVIALVLLTALLFV